MELDPLPRDVHRVCIPLAESMHLAHNETYYVTVWASNAGHKQLNSSAVSDGSEIFKFIFSSQGTTVSMGEHVGTICCRVRMHL